MASHHSIVILSHSDVQWFELTFTIALISFNYFHCPLDYFKFGWCKKFSQNQGLWLVESSESLLLIGREALQKFSKGVPLRSWISANGSLLKILHTVSGSPVTQWHSCGTVTLCWKNLFNIPEWHSIGIALTLDWFISGSVSSANCLYRGKWPRK